MENGANEQSCFTEREFDIGAATACSPSLFKQQKNAENLSEGRFLLRTINQGSAFIHEPDHGAHIKFNPQQIASYSVP